MSDGYDFTIGAITSGLRLEDSPFGPYDFINASNAPISPPGSVGDGWPSRAKSPHGSTNVNWPPGSVPFSSLMLYLVPINSCIETKYYRVAQMVEHVAVPL